MGGACRAWLSRKVAQRGLRGGAETESRGDVVGHGSVVGGDLVQSGVEVSLIRHQQGIGDMGSGLSGGVKRLLVSGQDRGLGVYVREHIVLNDDALRDSEDGQQSVGDPSGAILAAAAMVEMTARSGGNAIENLSDAAADVYFRDEGT